LAQELADQAAQDKIIRDQIQQQLQAALEAQKHCPNASTIESGVSDALKARKQRLLTEALNVATKMRDLAAKTKSVLTSDLQNIESKLQDAKNKLHAIKMELSFK